MLGMVWKDFAVMRKTVAYYFWFVVVYGLLCVFGAMPYSVLAGLVAVVGLMLPMSSFAYDDQARWEKFAASTPAGRRGVVNGKYLFALTSTFAAAVLVSAILTVMTRMGLVEAEAWWEPLAVVAACCCVTLLMDSVFLPLLLKFGSEKARLLSLVMFGAVFGSFALLAYLMERGVRLPPIPPAAAAMAPFLLAGGTALALAASRSIALRVYGKKEL